MTATVKAQRKLAVRPREAAYVTSLSPRKLWAMTASGEIPHLRVGRCVLYPLDQLEQWIAEQTKGGTANGNR